MISRATVKALRRKFRGLEGALDERARRLWAATEAQALGHGGIVAVCRATGLGRTTVWTGVRELEGRGAPLVGRARRPGGGRKALCDTDPALTEHLKALLEATTAGDPMSALKWTCKSTRTLAEELTRQGHRISFPTVARLVSELGYSLQANEKRREGNSHKDRDAQFRFINRQCAAFHRRGQPVISVDTKKKELVGDFKNAGRQWLPKGCPTPVRVHDFKDKKLGKAIPYGVYDIGKNVGWVNVGIDHDTAEFAVESIQQWWRRMGRRAYPNARELLITADGGGSNGAKNRLWKLSLQKLAQSAGLTIHVCHYPPGTSKWNRIEHRMFSHISMNWRGRPLESLEVIINLIANTSTRTGLRLKAALDAGSYVKGKKVSDKELAQINLKPSNFHGDWNYAIKPSKN
jgi:hypothetical protein